MGERMGRREDKGGGEERDWVGATVIKEGSCIAPSTSGTPTPIISTSGQKLKILAVAI